MEGLPLALLKKIREPWRKCLIVRLLGKTIGYKLFMMKMTKLWGLQADFEALDIGNGLFLVKFDMADDYMKVFTGGPWIVIDHYVTIRKWQQDFKPDEAEEDTTAIWVRFPNLPIEYYNEKVLYHIAKVLGVSLKIDINTVMAAMGNMLEIGHRRESCSDQPRGIPTEIGQTPNGEDSEKLNTNPSTGSDPTNKAQPKDAHNVRYGPWMTVSNKQRKPKSPNMNKWASTQSSNKLEVLTDNREHAKSNQAHDGKEEHTRGKAHTKIGFKYKTRPIMKSRDKRNSTDMATDKK
ncbi:uncharacterized protein LOC114259292 [Camellia sinensis]|uniref:uncharacterized protein LOC114259292 n=1 Tax=Camellia sinensis TaxID=4442 RepID=UPI0010366381|nr:uncharacterized protein LOC114259292 [Camellia sinensis]